MRPEAGAGPKTSHAELGKTLFLLTYLTPKGSFVAERNPFPGHSRPGVTPFPGGSSVPQSGSRKAFSVMTANTPLHVV